jgi:predicted RND superfamily exporter protein
VGFGSLVLCRHRGIFSLGFLAVVGSVFVLAAAVVLVPAVLAGMTPPSPQIVEKEEEEANKTLE